MTKIKTLEQLKRECLERQRSGFISLNGGLRSSKDIYFDGTTFDVFHSIDGTSETLTPRALMKTNIGEAIKLQSFYLH
jgi:hypothetical protein